MHEQRLSLLLKKYDECENGTPSQNHAQEMEHLSSAMEQEPQC
jgi:hypothetical protein